MGKLDNPAGRLHCALSSYNERFKNDETRGATWAKVLGVSQPEVPLHLWKTAELLAETYSAVSERHEDDPYRQLATHHMNEWAAPFVNGLAHGNERVGKPALLALDTISAVLSDTASEGTVPESDELQSLRDELASVIEETINSDEAQPELQQVIVERLHQIRWALDHVHIGGPAAVTAAVERLAGALVVRGREAVETPSARRSMSVALKLYGAFLSGPVVGQALRAWNDIAQTVLELGP